MNNAYALITGGSSGIGFEIAKDLAEMNKILKIVAISYLTNLIFHLITFQAI